MKANVAKKNPDSVVLSEMMTIKQVAAVLSVSTKTVRRMLDQGLSSMKFGRRRYINKSNLIQYIDTNKAS